MDYITLTNLQVEELHYDYAREICTEIPGKNNNKLNVYTTYTGKNICLHLPPVQYTKRTHQLRIFLVYRSADRLCCPPNPRALIPRTNTDRLKKRSFYDQPIFKCQNFSSYNFLLQSYLPLFY